MNPKLIRLPTFHDELGQLLEIANEIYGLDLKVRILEAENDINGGTTGPINLETGLKSVVVKYRLDFDNSEYVMTLNGEGKEITNINRKFSLPNNFMYVCTWRTIHDHKLYAIT